MNEPLSHLHLPALYTNCGTRPKFTKSIGSTDASYEKITSKMNTTSIESLFFRFQTEMPYKGLWIFGISREIYQE